MQMPLALRGALEREAARYKLSELQRAHERLSESYRAGAPLGRLSPLGDAERLAYAVARMPATYAACSAVLKAVMERMPAAPASLLDLGAGLGSMLWAAERLPALEAATLLEADPGNVQLGQALAAEAEGTEWAALRGADWRIGDIASAKLPPCDLVTCSYSLGELSEASATRALQTAWNAAKRMLVIIEPGTPAGFARIRKWRQQLLALGAHMVAPCPHSAGCPMVGNDWCHFAQRVERTSLHRRLKGGSLGYEDEKYSYIAVSKFPAALPSARIIRHPQVAPGAIKLELCAQGGLSEVVTTRKNKEQFRRARHAAWGDAWEPRPATEEGTRDSFE